MFINKDKGVLEFRDGERTLAIVIKKDYSKDGIEFFTPNDFSQQLAYMKYIKGKKIDAHVHNVVKRSVHYTNEVLIIKKGSLRVDFYNDEKKYTGSYILTEGDIILLISGGHGFTCLDNVEMLEVKQGPYLGDQDKTRFSAVDEAEVKII